MELKEDLKTHATFNVNVCSYPITTWVHIELQKDELLGFTAVNYGSLMKFWLHVEPLYVFVPQ